MDAVSELFRLRGEQKKKTALKPEFYSICNSTNESRKHYTLLFGDDLAKTIRGAKDASNISKKLSSGYRKKKP